MLLLSVNISVYPCYFLIYPTVSEMESFSSYRYLSTVERILGFITRTGYDTDGCSVYKLPKITFNFLMVRFAYIFRVLLMN